MEGKIRIAIDGPGGAGKSTVAKDVAGRLGADYIDTGAMYRAIACKIIARGISLDDRGRLKEMLDGTEIDFSNGNIFLDGRVVNDEIRAPEVSKMASASSALPDVREKLVALQKGMAEKKSVVMDGRDIGTNVLSDAEFKFYMTASAEERAKRRHAELIGQGQGAPYEKVLEEMIQRDQNDSQRALNPLRKAEGAIELDTTEMTAAEAADEIIRIVLEGKNGDNQGV